MRPLYPQWRRVATPIALAALSLLTAIVLWVAVTDAEDPNRVDIFSGAIEVRPVNIGEGLAVANIREAVVSFRVSASEDEFNRLTVNDFRAEVDLSGQRQTGTPIELRVTPRVVGGRDVEVVEVLPPFVSVTLEPSTSKLVPVLANVIGSPPQGFSYSGVEPNPASVRVTGAISNVQLVASASADVNLTGRRASLDEQFRLSPRDAQGADIRGVSVDPANADIKVNITQREVTLPLTIVPPVQGSVADGYNLAGISVEPAAVAVSGPLELLQALSFLTTETIDLSGLRADATRSVRLRVPAGLQTTRDTVSVRVKVVPVDAEIAVTVAPQVTNVPENLRADVQTSSVTVKLRGELPVVQAASATLRATVNAGGLQEGVHVLSPSINAPENVRVVSVEPQQVVVVLRR
jgi:YbbR domain-containing protein